MVLSKISPKKNKKGQIMIINLLFLVMTIAVLVALIPYLTTLLNLAQQSDYLNCKGYMFNGDPNNPLSYQNSSPSNVVACIGIDLYLPYIVMAVLIAGVSRVVLGRMATESGI